jgi:hypothetical protein
MWLGSETRGPLDIISDKEAIPKTNRISSNCLERDLVNNVFDEIADADEKFQSCASTDRRLGHGKTVTTNYRKTKPRRGWTSRDNRVF